MKMKPSITGVLVFVVVSLTGFAAQAMDNPIIARAKAQCICGESVSGYLGFPKGGAAPDVQREVRDVNLKRKAAYTSLAKRSGVTIDVAAALTGEKLVKRAPRGECVQTTHGWIKVQ